MKVQKICLQVLCYGLLSSDGEYNLSAKFRFAICICKRSCLPLGPNLLLNDSLVEHTYIWFYDDMLLSIKATYGS